MNLHPSYGKIKACAERVNSSFKFMNLPEKSYQKALVEELRDMFENVQQEFEMNYYYTTKNGRHIQIGSNKADILIDNQIIVEVKREKYYKKTTKETESQCGRYLHFLRKEVCFLCIFTDKDAIIRVFLPNNETVHTPELADINQFTSPPAKKPKPTRRKLDFDSLSISPPENNDSPK